MNQNDGRLLSDILSKQLLEANRTFDKDERDGVIQALQALCLFIEAQDWPNLNDMLRPLLRTLTSLYDLNNGRVTRITKPTEGFDNRPPCPMERHRVIGQLCVLVDVAKRSGYSVGEACQIIAAALQKRGFNLGGQRPTPGWRVIKNWRGEISRYVETHPRRKVYHALCAELVHARVLSKEECRNFIDDYVGQILSAARGALE